MEKINKSISFAKVEILSNGKLIVDGGDGKDGSGANFGIGGGAGGVIQIVSAIGNLSAHSLSLGRGSDTRGHCNQASETTEANGYYYLQDCNVTGHNKTFPGQYLYWNTKPNLTHTITTSSTSSQQTTTSSPNGIVERVNKLMNHSERLLISLEKNGEWNKSAFREVVSVHENLASSNFLSQKIIRPLCLEMFNIYRAIMDDIAERDPEFLKEALQGILEIASDCTEEKNHLIWKENRKLPELMQTLEETLVSSLQGNGSTEVNRVIVSSNAVAQVVRESSNASMTDITIPNISAVEGDSWKSVVDSLVIPRLTVMKAKGNYSYVFVLFKDVANALPSNPAKKRERISSADWEASSLLMSCFLMLDNVPVKDLSPPASLTFNTSVAQTLDKQCSFWDNNKSNWSAEGIKQISSVDSELTVCETNHFTSFAVLIKPRATELSHRDKLALSIITYVGCGVSTVALSITLIVFLSIESLSADRHKIHMNLVLSLLLAQVLFLAGIGETSNKVICKIIAVFMHYFYLTAFTWMLVEGLHLYLKVVQVFKTENVKILYYYIFGWGFAIIPVGITTALKPNKYGNSDICWLSLEDGTVWAFIGPVIAIIAVNGIVLLMVIKTVVTSAASIKSSEYDHIKAGIKGLFVLMPILGVGWILGLFAVNKATIVFEYAFAIVNGLQGLFIFLLHCAFNNEVRNAFRRQREKNALSKENDSQYQPTFSLSHSVESGGKEKRFSFDSQEKIKAPLSFKKKTTTRVVQVEPMRDRPDITDTLKVNRTFETGHFNKLAVTDEESEISSLHCPSLEDKERAPPKTFHLVNQRTSTKKSRIGPNQTTRDKMSFSAF
ncbi:PREDICTED: adhesion G-protein coupled receptor D1-like [Acropora digitifera]|uniref:adhesion G-protein coupled receptor D1-like n=1 Tax=Acropora digitifera TaxID=70779 RepID=UPI00077AB295|nr:PREDICTED: adhesion G-protein coupled receptor D1-like [Acropora digitifera]